MLERAGRLYITCDEATTCIRQIPDLHLDLSCLFSFILSRDLSPPFVLQDQISHRANLQSKMRSGLYLSGWLIATAFASPLVVDIGPRVKDSDSDRSHNLSLADAPLPWGPKEFGSEIRSEGRNALDPRSVYGLALLMATMLAIGDFEGELPNNPATFVNIAFPHIGAAVYRPTPREPVPRKYVHWGLARVMNRMIREQDYKDNIYNLFWTDPNRATRKAGELYIGPSPPRMGAGNGGSLTTPSLLSQALNSTEIVLGAGSQPTNGTQASIHGSNNGLTYQYDYHGDEMTIEDVVMGTLGSINEAAEFHDRSRHTTYFVGSFPRYYAFCLWSGGPGFTYSIMIQSLRQAATAAMNANNFHELRIVLRNNGVEIARGGYITKPEPDQASASVATS